MKTLLVEFFNTHIPLSASVDSFFIRYKDVLHILFIPKNLLILLQEKFNALLANCLRSYVSLQFKIKKQKKLLLAIFVASQENF